MRNKSIRPFYLPFLLAACQPGPEPQETPPEQAAPPAIAALTDPDAARSAVAEGRAVAVREGPVGLLAVGLQAPRPLGSLPDAPDKLAAALAGAAPERLILMPDAGWSEGDLLALCAAARGATRPALPCERAGVDLLEPPDAALTVEVMARQVHAQAGAGGAEVDRAAAAAVAAAAVPEWTGCYRAARLERPEVGGRIVLEVSIGQAGAVDKAAVTRGWEQPDFEGCVAGVAAGWIFEGVAPGSLIAFPVMFVAR